MISTADISPCGRYRWTLRRAWGSGPTLAWVMLNPSTADAHADDPTIRKCIGFAKRLGYAKIIVANVCPLRETSPSAMVRDVDTIPPEVWRSNREAVDLAIREAKATIVAWGNHVERRPTLLQEAESIRARHHSLQALRFNAGGQPAHPLMLPYACSPAWFRAESQDVESGDTEGGES